ncbi:hypothetical protein ANN_00533 [Periplaneta americana]|uniref:Uncharacterized protein n=1 Tax=Periplaneta americana TaxID=6978 RepID=A0ABQ8TS69_PERAM|nr:hypothetical protein ANN_00533 [Periplaneta americana]
MVGLCEGGNEPPDSLKASKVSVYVSVVYGMGDDDEDEERKRGNPVPARSLLLSNSNKEAGRLNVPVRRTNHYQ